MGVERYEAVELADAIGAVREEVIAAQMAAQGRPLSFRVGPVEMEFEVALTRSAEYSGRLRVAVVTTEKRPSLVSADITTHRVKLTLEPGSLVESDEFPMP